MNDYSSETAGAGLAMFGVGFMLFWLAFMILIIAAGWKIYTKAGQPGWAVLIPFYSTLIHLKIIGKPAIWLLYLFIPFYNIYIAIMMIHLLSKSFGKDTGFTVGLIFLPYIFYPIMAFSSNIRYIGPGGNPNGNVDAAISNIGLS